MCLNLFVQFNLIKQVNLSSLHLDFTPIVYRLNAWHLFKELIVWDGWQGHRFT